MVECITIANASSSCYHALSQLIVYVTSTRVAELACMHELLRLYLLYLLTWHRIAKLRTVKSGVQVPKDGGARARVGCS